MFIRLVDTDREIRGDTDANGFKEKVVKVTPFGKGFADKKGLITFWKSKALNIEVSELSQFFFLGLRGLSLNPTWLSFHTSSCLTIWALKKVPSGQIPW